MIIPRSMSYQKMCKTRLTNSSRINLSRNIVMLSGNSFSKNFQLSYNLKLYSKPMVKLSRLSSFSMTSLNTFYSSWFRNFSIRSFSQMISCTVKVITLKKSSLHSVGKYWFTLIWVTTLIWQIFSKLIRCALTFQWSFTQLAVTLVTTMHFWTKMDSEVIQLYANRTVKSTQSNHQSSQKWHQNSKQPKNWCSR